MIPYFGQMNMDNIRPYHIQAYINQATQKYAPETVKKDYNVLSLIFQNAVDNQICTHNPIVKSIQLPKHEPVSGKRAYSQEQYDLIYSYAKTTETAWQSCCCWRQGSPAVSCWAFDGRI